MFVFVLVIVFFFFVKQKTAYDMRISDWSSDVCSSDLFLQVALLVPSDLSDRRIDRVAVQVSGNLYRIICAHALDAISNRNGRRISGQLECTARIDRKSVV